MQKLADGHDTRVGTSTPWLRSRCAAAPHVGAARDCEVADWPPVWELAAGSGGADDDPSHPVAAPASRMDTQADASHSRPVMRGTIPIVIRRPPNRHTRRVSPLAASAACARLAGVALS